MSNRKLLAVLILIMSFLSIMPVRVTAQDDGTIARITSPTDNGSVSGQVIITGTAAHSSLFAGYELEFDNLTDSNEIWIPIGQRVNQQVNNGTLTVWDTVTDRIADGKYQLRLSVYLSDGTGPITFVVNNLQVINTAPTELPNSTIIPAFTPTPLVPPTDGPSPTPLIQQPPTTVPRSTPQLNVNPVAEDSGSGTNISFNLGSLQQAFCSGVYWGLGFFVLFGIYLAVRAKLRPTARQFWWQIRNELDQDR